MAVFGICWDGGRSKPSLGSFGICWGGSKPSLGSLDVCWEWDGASFHWGVWVVLGGGRSKPSLGWVYVGREAEQAFTREFGYMLGGRRSKSSLGIWMGRNFILRRMHVFVCIGGGGGGGKASLHKAGSKPSLGSSAENSVLPFVHISMSTLIIYGFNFKEYGRVGYFKKTSVQSLDKLKPWIHHIQK